MFNSKFDLGQEVKIMYNTATIVSITRDIEDRDKYYYQIEYVENGILMSNRVTEETLLVLNPKSGG